MVLLKILKKAVDGVAVCGTMIGIIFISQRIIESFNIAPKSPDRLMIYFFAFSLGIVILIALHIFIKMITDDKKQVQVSISVIAIVGIIIGIILINQNNPSGWTVLIISSIVLLIVTLTALCEKVIHIVLILGIVLLLMGIVGIVVKRLGLSPVELMAVVFILMGVLGISGFFLHRRSGGTADAAESLEHDA